MDVLKDPDSYKHVGGFAYRREVTGGRAEGGAVGREGRGAPAGSG
jgi:hypothetical protein